MTLNAEWINPLEAPGAAAAIAEITSAPSQLPDIPELSDTIVNFEVGLHRFDGTIIKDAEIREFTGRDEEELAKVQRNATPARYLAKLLELGTVKIGDSPASPDDLRTLIAGDRTALLVGIRRATFGDEVAVEKYPCPKCKELLDIELSLRDDIPVTSMDELRKELKYNDDHAAFEVTLPKSKKRALIRLYNGDDQEAMLASADLTIPEQDTVLLSRIVIGYLEGDLMVATRGDSQHILNMGSKDRKKLVEVANEIQVGPRLDKVKVTHQTCGEEINIPLSIDYIFRDLNL